MDTKPMDSCFRLEVESKPKNSIVKMSGGTYVWRCPFCDGYTVASDRVGIANGHEGIRDHLVKCQRTSSAFMLNTFMSDIISRHDLNRTRENKPEPLAQIDLLD